MKSVGLHSLAKANAKVFGLQAALIALIATGCGKGADPFPLAAAPHSEQQSEQEFVQETEQAEQAGQALESVEELSQAGKVIVKPKSALGLPAWGGAPARRSWANAVLGVVRARIRDLEKARDVETFCPGYRSASAAQKHNCWLLVVAAISKFESNFVPSSSFREPDGNYSVGMMAMSPGECPNAPKLNDLKVAVPNLICGTNRMAMLIARDGYIDGPDPRRGAARYWSTLRKPYKRWDPTRDRYLNLGKRNLILPLVKGYRGGRSLASVEAQWESGLASYVASMPVAPESHEFRHED
jgi:hypothetical protein